MNAPSLHVAVAADVDPCWFDLLVRSGLPVRWLGTCDHSAAVLFLPDRAGLTSAATRALVERCTRQGLGIVAGAQWGSLLLGGRVRTVHATEVLAGARGLPASPMRLHCDVEVLASATEGRVLPADIPATASATSPSPVLVLPLPTIAGLRSQTLRPVAVAAGSGAVTAMLAGVDQAALRALCTAALMSMAHRSGRPFARLATAPAGFAGTLAVRVDAEVFEPTASAAVLTSLQAAGQRASWFVDVQQHLAVAGGREAIAALATAGHEIQSHCLRHYAWRAQPRNRSNLQRSQDAMATIGIRAQATAAPGHVWSAAFATAVRDAGLAWWSGVAVANDEAPGTFGGDPAGAWQLPVQAIGPAQLLAAGRSEAALNDWFGALLLAKLRDGEPTVLHVRAPGELDLCPGLLPHLDRIARAQPQTVWRPTLGELFAFHRARAEQAVECRLGPDTVHGEVGSPAELWLEQPDGTRVTVQGSFSLPRLTVAPGARPDPVLVPAASRDARPDRRRSALDRLRR